MSGGLDSLLAIRLLQEQDIEVTGITFISPFFGSKNAEQAAGDLGVELIVVDVTEEHLSMVKNPRHGYGKFMNPCLDCHALMIRKAGEILERDRFDLIATGEVLGERPMSQNRRSLKLVALESGYEGLVLRPLSAKLLPPTIPETKGLVDRKRLMDIKGRSRKPQMALAKKFGITRYVQPAGGCLLTEPNFSARLGELLKKNPDAGAHDVNLLKLGRHFRLPSGAKAIVGRNQQENEVIMAEFAEGRILILSDITPGPATLLVGGRGQDDMELAARLCASYADHGGQEVDMELISAEGRRRIKARPAPRNEFEGIKI